MISLASDKSGIYKITNIKNGKIYIGSAVNLRKRKNHHFCSLKNNKHKNSYLQHAWNKDGENNFTFEIIEVVDDLKMLIPKEQFWIDKTLCTDPKYGYNLSPVAGSGLGLKHTEENKRKLSEARTGEKCFTAKLTNKDVVIIKQLINQGYRQKDIAKRFGVSPQTISNIKTGSRWNFVDIPIDKNIKPLYKNDNYGQKNGMSKLTEKDVIEIKQLLSDGETCRYISKIFNVNECTISKIKQKTRWKYLDSITDNIDYNLNL